MCWDGVYSRERNRVLGLWGRTGTVCDGMAVVAIRDRTVGKF